MFETYISKPLKKQRLAGGVVSVLLHCALVIVLFAIAVPEVIERPFHATTLYLPPVGPAAPRPQPIIAPKPAAKLGPAMPSYIQTRHFQVQARPVKAELALSEAPPIPTPPAPPVPALTLSLPPVPPAPIPAVAVRKPEIHTGGFESSVTPVSPVQAGRAIDAAISPQPSGFDSATAEPAKTTHAAVAGGAFSSGTEAAALLNRSAARPQRAEVASTQFDVVAAKSSRRTAPANPPSGAKSPLEIISKPRPLYTEEARRLHIEGDVVLQVSFRASSEVCVLRVLHGLGHGLDEKAIAAASSIHFRPATEGGRPIDDVATVRITFQLAD